MQQISKPESSGQLGGQLGGQTGEQTGDEPMSAAGRLGGYRILITGASGGIGRAIALALAAESASMVISGRNKAMLAEVARECAAVRPAHGPAQINSAYSSGQIPETDRNYTAASGQFAPGNRADAPVVVLAGDLADSQFAVGLPAAAAGELGGLDCVINAAGLALQRSVEETDAELWDAIMAVNARAPFLICRHALPFLEASARPHIINISSIVGRQGYPLQAAYTASKHALEGFSKSLAREVHSRGIPVIMVAPGGVDTPMIREMRPDVDADSCITPDAVAEAIVFTLTRRGNGIIDRIDMRRPGKEPQAQ